MKHTFQYAYSLQPLDSFFVEDISNVILNLLNDLGQEWYISVKTTLGDTEIAKYGPCLVDISEKQDHFKYEYSKFQYNENKIISEVDKYINNQKNAITQIIEIDEDTFNNRLEEILYGCAN